MTEMWEQSYNGLDPAVWGNLAHFKIAPDGATELEYALELLGYAQDKLDAICRGEHVSLEAAAFLHDYIACAAMHYGWWMGDQDVDDTTDSI